MEEIEDINKEILFESIETNISNVEMLDELILVQENQIIFNNNLVDSVEIFIVFCGLLIGLILGNLFVRVTFNGT